MSSSNRERRQRNRAARTAAAEEALRRARRRRIALTIVGLALALVVGIALVARATGGNGSSAASTTTTSTTSVSSTSTTVPAPKRCVAMQKPLPKNTPLVPVVVGDAPTKLVKRDVTAGTGAVVKPGDMVTVNYVGVLCSTGKVFGSTYDSAPQPLSLKGTIPGWQQGIPGMRVGGERLLGIPAALGYGAAGTPDGTVGPDEPLWFLVQVVKDS